MIDETVRERRGPQREWLICFLAAFALIAGEAAVEEGYLGRLAVAPGVVGVVLLITYQWRFAVRFERDGINVLAPQRQFIAYSSIEALRRDEDGDEDSFEFDVIHSRGVLHVPRDLDVSSAHVFEFLRSQFPAGEPENVPPSLRPFRYEQVMQFGIERVWSFHAQPRARAVRSWRPLWLSVAACFVGGIWLSTPQKERFHTAWTVVGALSLTAGILGTFVVAVVASTAARRAGPSGPSGIVISPLAFALEQGDLRGRMRWDEITAITRKTNTVVVAFAGGTITIRDIYNRPIGEIYRRLCEYWDGPE
jgi:hypothetical protein